MHQRCSSCPAAETHAYFERIGDYGHPVGLLQAAYDHAFAQRGSDGPRVFAEVTARVCVTGSPQILCSEDVDRARHIVHSLLVTLHCAEQCVNRAEA